MSDLKGATPVAFDEQGPAHVQVIQMAGGYIIARAVHALAQLGIADYLKGGARSIEDIARATDADASSLYRLLRSMAGFGFLVEGVDRHFSLTPLGATLQTQAPGYALSTVRTLAAPGMWSAFGEFLRAVKTGDPAMKQLDGAAPFYDLSGRPEQSALLNETMIGFHGAEPPAVVAAYDFSRIRKLVDVGGNTGNLLTTVLLANPGITGVIYDLPHVAAEASRQVKMKGLSGRCEVVGGNFFENVPGGGDAYMLSHVIYDWDDVKCLKILGNCRQAMQARGRLLVVDHVMPPGNDFHPGKFIDLILMATTGGKVRTKEEHAVLLAQAGFNLTRIVPTQSAVSIVEAEPA